MPRVKHDKRFPLTTADVDFVAMCEEQGIDRVCYTCTGFYVCFKRKSEGCVDKTTDEKFLNNIITQEKSWERLQKKWAKENKTKQKP